MTSLIKKRTATLLFAGSCLIVLAGCRGDPRLSVKNTFAGTVFYEITIAGNAAAYLSGQMVGGGSKTLTLEAGRNLLIFVQPDTTGNQQNFITLDSLLAEEGKKYLLELNPQYVSGHQHGSPRAVPAGPIETQSKRNFLR
ncbi:MAG: hypothetical protein L0Z48_00635 [candidate division Zixibacteria bacterium]|nr:hypothetical protein [candidate division Zixibacteria bacterium]MCI0595030.1 hypothetical protein [candidate division Zixibacteria bacterium]